MAGGGSLSNIYQLTTLDPRFEVAFTQDGLHIITVEGTIDDIWGIPGPEAAPTKSTSVGSWLWIPPCYPALTLRLGMGSIRGW